MSSEKEPAAAGKLRPYLGPLNVWALSFGCAVGWGAFVMPGTTFLPIGGPWGVALGMIIGGAVMLLMGYNYYYMMKHIPDTGGTYSFATKVLGSDHGFLAAWFLLLVYLAITWANATALSIITRRLLGDYFQWGFHYTLAGFDVYGGEVLLILGVMWVCALLCTRGGSLAAKTQTVMATLLLLGILAAFGAALTDPRFDLAAMTRPAFPPGEAPLAAIFGIVALAPWAFVGFESISQSTAEFKFPVKKSFAIMVAAIVAAVIAYVALAWLAVSLLPTAYGNWPTYIRDLDKLTGLSSLPTFHAVEAAWGDSGIFILAVAVMGGVITGLLGNYIAGSRLIWAVSADKLLPGWFARVNSRGVPVNAILFITLVSLPIPFLGRAAISWIVDVNTIGACIAYAYTSYIAWQKAVAEDNKRVRITGLVGFVGAILFLAYFLLPFIGVVTKMAPESYLILIIWSILGFVAFRYVFVRDKEQRLGRSINIWMALLFLVFLTSVIWMRETTQDTTKYILQDLGEYYAAEMWHHGIVMEAGEMGDAEAHMEQQLAVMGESLTWHNLLQMVIITVMLLIMLNIYQMITKRERILELQKIQAEEVSAAKSRFFFNMSHDIRTPMNAIVGYVELAKRVRANCDTCPKCDCEHGVPEKLRDFMDKTDAASQHFLSLINDILEMSRIENGKMELEPVSTNLHAVMNEVRDLFINQMESKGLTYTVATEGLKDAKVLCDNHRLNRVLLNLVGNSVKFTPAGGKVDVFLKQLGREKVADETAEGDRPTFYGSYEIRVKDTGMGMSEEFAGKIFEAYSRASGTSEIQGTGLGMAITKNIIDLMGGTIEIKTKLKVGTEFIIGLKFPLDTVPEGDTVPEEDIDMNREIATMLLSEYGFIVDTAVNGKEALEKIAASKPGYYRLILMDIQMPVMNGYEATRAIRALKNPQLAAIPIIAMTANAFSEDVQDALNAGMNGHIAKPLDVEKMLATMAEVLKDQGGTT
ncbi:MAG: amino acid permease [Selenomonadaceae bacterium]|nr:amino acid permease [Selenomonadaceae bacterium]